MKRRRCEAKYSKEWQDLEWGQQYELTRNIPGNHNVIGQVNPSGDMMGVGTVTLPSGTPCDVVIQWWQDPEDPEAPANWNNWGFCDDLSVAEARKAAARYRRELKCDARWERETRRLGRGRRKTGKGAAAPVSLKGVGR